MTNPKSATKLEYFKYPQSTILPFDFLHGCATGNSMIDCYDDQNSLLVQHLQ